LTAKLEGWSIFSCIALLGHLNLALLGYRYQACRKQVRLVLPLLSCAVVPEKWFPLAKSGAVFQAALATGMCRLLPQHFLFLGLLGCLPKLLHRHNEVSPSVTLKGLLVCKFYSVYKTTYCKKTYRAGQLAAINVQNQFFSTSL